jgi:YesN/AraC family two-component response regulator
VLVAEDGIEALRVRESAEGMIDLLVTDIVMPGLGGLELAEKVREVEPEVKVLFISGYAGDSTNALISGVEDRGMLFLQKPFPTSVLGKQVREILDRDD